MEDFFGMISVIKGDTYNGVLLWKELQIKTKPDGEDITNLYQTMVTPQI
jgi:outer membrane protein insertion porin family